MLPIEDIWNNAVTKEYVGLLVSQAKNDLVKWIIGGVICNGIIVTFLKYLG